MPKSNAVSRVGAAVGGLMIALLAGTSRATPVEYVRVCSLYGAGFYYIPGTDMCADARGQAYRVRAPGDVVVTNIPGADATALGQHSFGYGDQSVAVGENAWAGGDPTSAAFGGTGSSLVGVNGQPGPGGTTIYQLPGSAFFNAGTTAIGDNARAGAGAAGETNATAVGQNASANGANASAFGQNASANAAGASAFGQNTSANAAGASAFGQNASANVAGASAFGQNAAANGASAAAFGQASNASADYSTAIGAGSQASQLGATAVGYGAVASGDPATALGMQATASGNNSVAIGASATASGSTSTALGAGATASGGNATALGQGAAATGANSVAIGAGSIANEPNTVSVGTPGAPRRITNIAPGIEPGDAVNFQQFSTERTEARQGIAAVAAMTTAPMPSAAGKVSWAANASTFRGEYGFGGSLAYRFDTGWPLAATAGAAYGGSSTFIGRVGLQGEF